MLKVALTHDVDRTKKSYQYITHSLKAMSNFDFKRLSNQLESIFLPDRYWGFDEIIKIESEFNVKSTFFFLNESIPFKLFNPLNWKLSLGRYDVHDSEIMDIIRLLDKNGWEIGMHGSFNSYNDRQLLLHEKESLEHILGHKIVGIRQHYLNLSGNTWDFQHATGLKYDSSWGLSNEIGFKEDKIKPFKPLNNEFLVIPMAIMDNAFVKSEKKWDKLKRIMEQTIKEDSILVINWHTNYYDESEFPNYKSDYIGIIREFKKNEARFYTLKDYYSEINSGN